jgi:hypothetical protein
MMTGVAGIVAELSWFERGAYVITEILDINPALKLPVRTGLPRR